MWLVSTGGNNDQDSYKLNVLSRSPHSASFDVLVLLSQGWYVNYKPVPMVFLPSLKVKHWPFSEIIGCYKTRLSFKSSPGMASSFPEGKVTRQAMSQVRENMTGVK